MITLSQPIKRVHNRIALIILLGIAGLFACLIIVGAAQARKTAAYLPEGYVVHMCGGASVQKPLWAGVWWLSPHAQDVPSWAYVSRSFPACAFIPWLPFLPQHGALMWTP
jgi:hypothetical protein